MARYDEDDDQQVSRRGSGKQGFASMSKDRVRQIASKGGRTSNSGSGARSNGSQKRSRAQYDSDEDDEDDYDSYDNEDDEGDSGRGKNANRVQGGKKAAETRRKRGTGHFENMSHDELSELGRKGGRSSSGGGSRGADDEYSGRHPSGYSDREIQQHRKEVGRKAAETRSKRGNDFFKNNSREQQAELGRRGGSRSFGSQQNQDDEEEDAYSESEDEEPKSRSNRRR